MSKLPRTNCWLWHDWGRWRTYVWEGTTIEGTEITTTKQARVCWRCGREQHRTVANAVGGTFDNAGMAEPVDAPGLNPGDHGGSSPPARTTH